MRRILPESVLEEVGRLDPAAIAQVREEAWPDVRDADELHDVLHTLIALPVNHVGSDASWVGFEGARLQARRESFDEKNGAAESCAPSKPFPAEISSFLDSEANPHIARASLDSTAEGACPYVANAHPNGRNIFNTCWTRGESQRLAPQTVDIGLPLNALNLSPSCFRKRLSIHNLPKSMARLLPARCIARPRHGMDVSYRADHRQSAVIALGTSVLRN